LTILLNKYTPKRIQYGTYEDYMNVDYMMGFHAKIVLHGQWFLTFSLQDGSINEISVSSRWK